MDRLPALVREERKVAAFSIFGITLLPGPGCGSAHIAVVSAQIRLRQPITSPSATYPTEIVRAVRRDALGERPG